MFEESLSPIEQTYRDKLLALFALVNPQKPEIGVRVLIERARVLSENRAIPIEEALEEVYRGAKERTERRVMLLNACRLQQ